MAGGNVDDGHHPLAAGKTITYDFYGENADYFKP